MCLSGVTCSTARDVQLEAKAKGTPWMISKSYDCFAPVSAFIAKEDVPDPHALDLWMTINGKLIQKVCAWCTLQAVQIGAQA